MGRVLKKAVIGVGLFVVAAQFIRPGLASPTTDERRTIQSNVGAGSELVAVLDRACNDCHSNVARWPRYTRSAPLSWIWVRAVNEGRKAVNFSEWTTYPPEKRRALLETSCTDARKGSMPVWPYASLRPEAKLTPHDIETLCKQPL